jgi:hypothetical protein
MNVPTIAYDTTPAGQALVQPSPGGLQPAGYAAGACNIGPAEIAARRRSGYAGIAAAAVLGVVLLAVDAPAPARLLVALPLAGGAIGLLQARSRFCAAYGMAGVRNFGPLGNPERVVDADARRADRAKSLRIIAGGAAVGLAGGALFALLPI